MRVEQVADLFGRGFGQPPGFRLELAQLALRDRDRLSETATFRLDLGLGEVALADREIAAFGDVSRPDGDPRRYPEAPQSALASDALVDGPGDFVNLH